MRERFKVCSCSCCGGGGGGGSGGGGGGRRCRSRRGGRRRGRRGRRRRGRRGRRRHRRCRWLFCFAAVVVDGIVIVKLTATTMIITIVVTARMTL